MKKIIFLAILVLFTIACGAGFYILSQPPKEKLTEEFKEQAVTRLLGRKAQLNESSAPTGEKVFDGNKISFRYPARALIYTYREESTSSKSSQLDDFSFDIKEPKLIFNMTVISNNSGITSVADYPAARLREQRAYEYTKSTPKIDASEGVAYLKKDKDPEKSGFFLYEGMIYSFSVTGVESEEVEELFDSILATADFK